MNSVSAVRFIMLLFLALLAGCAGGNRSDATIRGLVVDSWGNPVQGIDVLVDGVPSAKTDALGFFQLQTNSADSPVVVKTSDPGQGLTAGAHRGSICAQRTGGPLF